MKLLPLLTLLLTLGLNTAGWMLPLPTANARGGGGQSYSGGHSSSSTSSGGPSFRAGTSHFYGYSSSRAYTYETSDPRIVRAFLVVFWVVFIGIFVLVFWKKKNTGK